jgi:hypothetical protein
VKRGLPHTDYTGCEFSFLVFLGRKVIPFAPLRHNGTMRGPAGREFGGGSGAMTRMRAT